MNSRKGKRMMTAAGKFALSRFALNYTMYYEMTAEKANSETEKDTPLSLLEQEAEKEKTAAEQELLSLVGRLLKGEAPIDDVDIFRCRMIEESKKIMAYIENFTLYNRVLLRKTERFSDQKLELETDEEIVNQIMGYIISAKETAQINQRIKMVLSELPLRFTKAKFFSMVRQALSIYEGTDRRALEMVLDMLRREALLDLPPGMNERHELLFDRLREIKEADYQHLNKENFSLLCDKIEEAKESLMSLSSDSVNLMDLINDLYVICLTRQDMLMDSQEKESLYALISLIWERLSQKDYSLSEEDLTDHLIPLEGKQEAYYDQWSRFEGVDAESVLGNEASQEEREIVRKVDLLLSTSLYMSLEPEEEGKEEGILLSRKAVEEMCQPFFDALEMAWKGKAKCVVRIEMANLLSYLPMFFLTSDELREFLTGCFSSCTDLAEKYACVQAIMQMVEMENKDALV